MRTDPSSEDPVPFIWKHKDHEGNSVPLTGIQHTPSSCAMGNNAWATGFYFQLGEREGCQALSMAYLPYHIIKTLECKILLWTEKSFCLPPLPTCTHACTHVGVTYRERVSTTWGSEDTPEPNATSRHTTAPHQPWAAWAGPPSIAPRRGQGTLGNQRV